MANANENSVVLEATGAGEKLTPADLAHVIATLNDEAKKLNALKAGKSEMELQAIEVRQSELRAMAMKLNSAAIDLLTDEARVSADHLNAAIDYAKDVLALVDTVKKTLAGLGLVIDFFAVALTGSGTQIVKAAIKLKGGLDDLKAA